MCEVDDQGHFSPAGFAASIGHTPVTITFPNLPDHEGTLAYGMALREHFPMLPADPFACVDLIKELSSEERKIISVTVANAADEDDPQRCPLELQATISVIPKLTSA